jgi:hypothetical protein
MWLGGMVWVFAQLSVQANVCLLLLLLLLLLLSQLTASSRSDYLQDGQWLLKPGFVPLFATMTGCEVLDSGKTFRVRSGPTFPFKLHYFKCRVYLSRLKSTAGMTR